MAISTLTAVRVRYPDSLSENSKILAKGALTRFACLHSGRVLSDMDNTFFLTDLEGRWVQHLLRICEVNGLVATVRLLSPAFFDKLFAGGVA